MMTSGASEAVITTGHIPSMPSLMQSQDWVGSLSVSLWLCKSLALFLFLCLKAAEKLRNLPEEHYKTRGEQEKEDGGK